MPASESVRRLVSQMRLMELRDMAQEGVAEGALFELPCAEMIQLLEHIDILGTTLDIYAGDYCRVCGCTEDTPCDPPCAWSVEGLCTSCHELLHEEEAARVGACPACEGKGDRGEQEPFCGVCDGSGLAPELGDGAAS